MGPNPPPNTTARARNRPERRTARIPQDPGRFAYRYLLRLLLILERLVLVGGVAAGAGVDQLAVAVGVAADRDLVGGAVLGVVDVVAVGLVGVAEGVHPVGGRGDLGQHRGDAAVAHHAGPGRDQLADDDVLLEADQRVALALDGRLGQHPCGLLEGGRRQPRLGGQRRLGDAEQLGTAVGRRVARLQRLPVGPLERGPLDQLAGEQLGVAALEHGHPLEHLADDQLDVLVVDGHTLAGVDLLDLLDQVPLGGPDAEHPQHLLGVGDAVDDRLADLDLLAVLDPEPGPPGDDGHPLLALVRGHGDLHALLDVLDPDPAGELGDGGHALGGAGLEQLLHPRQAVGDVLTGDAAGVEGPHGQLGAGLADRLGGDDADRLADVDQPVVGQAAAVAQLAHPDLGVAGQHRAAQHLLDAVLDQQVDHLFADLGAGLEQDLLPLAGRVHDVLGQDPGQGLALDRARPDPLELALLARDRPLDGHGHGDAPLGAAVALADDHVLGDVDQPPGQVARVGRAQGGVGQALAGAVGRDEVLEHRQALAEVGLDGPRDDVALG